MKLMIQLNPISESPESEHVISICKLTLQSKVRPEQKSQKVPRESQQLPKAWIPGFDQAPPSPVQTATSPKLTKWN